MEERLGQMSKKHGKRKFGWNLKGRDDGLGGVEAQRHLLYGQIFYDLFPRNGFSRFLESGVSGGIIQFILYFLNELEVFQRNQSGHVLAPAMHNDPLSQVGYLVE
jgi:hypothetical protein